MEDIKLLVRMGDGTLKQLDKLLKVDKNDIPINPVKIPQEMRPLKFKKLDPAAVLPSYANLGDAGLDLTATSKEYNKDYGFWEYGTGLAVEIPEGFVGLIFPRSSISKTPLSLCNSVGVIDSGYRGEIKFRFTYTSSLVDSESFGLVPRISLNNVKPYKVGDRIGQLVILQLPSFYTEFVDELSDSKRGTGGFGSSGA